jgi:Zn-dependent metalloprotease
MQRLLRIVADKDIENDKRLRDYTYIEREVENKLDGKGQTKSTEMRTYEIMEIYGEQVQRLIQKNDKPLSEKDAAKEEEKIQKIVDKRKNESEAIAKTEEKEEKEREEDRKFVREIADAYNFKL